MLFPFAKVRAVHPNRPEAIGANRPYPIIKEIASARKILDDGR
jgi:hypothetical protein